VSYYVARSLRVWLLPMLLGWRIFVTFSRLQIIAATIIFSIFITIAIVAFTHLRIYEQTASTGLLVELQRGW
jgi:hypothetical protein